MRKKHIIMMLLICFFISLFNIVNFLNQPQEKMSKKYSFKNIIYMFLNEKNEIEMICKASSLCLTTNIMQSQYPLKNISGFVYAYNSTESTLWVYSSKISFIGKGDLNFIPISKVPKKELMIVIENGNLNKILGISVYLPFYGDVKDWKVISVSENQLQVSIPSIPCFILIYGEDFHANIFVASNQKYVKISEIKCRKLVGLKAGIEEKSLSYTIQSDIDILKIALILLISLIFSTTAYFIGKQKLRNSY